MTENQAVTISGNLNRQGVDDEAGKQVPFEITITEFGIAISIKDYGFPTEQGGAPIFIEHWDGELRVLVWDDINREDPQTISMDGAREEYYTGR